MSIKKYILFPVCLMFGLMEAQAQIPESDFKAKADSIQKATEAKVYRTSFKAVDKKHAVRTMSTITGEELTSYADMNISNALQGRLLGLQVIHNASTPGSGSASITVRGKSRDSNNDPLILVDGIERDWISLNAEEIETITVMKDMTAKVLYGLKATNGVILIQTKRGVRNSFKVSAGYEQGIKTPTSSPEYLSADEYATYYNQARVNDGLAPLYTEEQIQTYKNGTDPILFPNVDFHDYALNKQTDFKRAYVNFLGGSQKSAYFVHLGYANEGGMEKFGNKTSYDRINVRANLDLDLADWVTVKADLSGRVEFRDSPNMTSSEFFTLLSTTRPNEYPVFIEETGDRESNILGGSLFKTRNVYGEMMYAGYDQRVDRNIRTRFGFDFNLNNYVQGLKAGVYASLDGNSRFEYGKNEGYSTYVPLSMLDDGYDLLQVQQGVKSDDQVRKANSDFLSTTFYAHINYNRVFAEKHKVGLTAIGYRQTTSTSNSTQYGKTLHTGLSADYIFDGRYILEASAVLAGTNKFAEAERLAPSSAIGLGWIASNESFLKGNEIVTFLKLKGSWGVMAYDPAYWTYPHLQRFSENGTANFGDSNGNKFPAWSPSRDSNEDLGYERAYEFNLGTEFTLFKQLSFEVNYFNNARRNMHTNYGNIYPDYYGYDGAFFNNNTVLSTGLEVAVNYHKSFGDLRLDVGANLMHQKATWDKMRQVDGIIEGLNREGLPVDGIYGYRNNGLFGSVADIEGSPKQYTGNVRAGDIKYQDLNQDGKVDMDDREYLGNSTPTLSYGVQINATYKNFNLFIAGAGLAGHYRNNNSSYYQLNGRDKYSELAKDSWTPETAGTAKYPALSTAQAENNFVTSDFWLEKAGFFRLKNIELGYTLPETLVQKMGGVQSKVFLRGSNLFEITASENKNLDPERPNTGITNYPIMRSFTMGVSINL